MKAADVLPGMSAVWCGNRVRVEHLNGDRSVSVRRANGSRATAFLDELEALVSVSGPYGSIRLLGDPTMSPDDPPRAISVDQWLPTGPGTLFGIDRSAEPLRFRPQTLLERFADVMGCIASLLEELEVIARALFASDERLLRFVERVDDALIGDGEVDRERMHRAFDRAWERDELGKRTECFERAFVVLAAEYGESVDFYAWSCATHARASHEEFNVHDELREAWPDLPVLSTDDSYEFRARDLVPFAHAKACKCDTCSPAEAAKLRAEFDRIRSDMAAAHAKMGAR